MGVVTTRLEINRSGVWEIRWTERDGDGRGRTRAVSTRTKDRAVAEAVRVNFLRAEAQEEAHRAGAGGDTLAGLIQAYEDAARKRGVSRSTISSLVRIKQFFGAMGPGGITPEVVGEFLKSRTGRADSTVRRELSALTAVLNWGKKHGRVATVPFIELPPNGAPRAVFLDEAAEGELFALASRDVRKDGRLSRVGRFICIGLETGARKAAIEGLTWDRVDLVKGTIDFRDPSLRVTRKRRVATPITARLRPVLERALAERTGKKPTDFVLDDNGNGRKAWETFMRRKGFEDLTPHVLRHTRITLLLRAGVSAWDVSALVGASVNMIVDVYSHHIVDDRLRAQADRRFGAAVPVPA